tara:strand:+ start:995 stop:1483 length:489 start_codon:yes stop_codon:yes gene_type:complete
MYIVPFYTNGWTEFDAMVPDVVSIDWQLRLLSYLSENGHTILVKQHPNSTVRMPRFFFESIGVKDIVGKFEDVYYQADIILTDYSGSTTFGSALKSDKPVIFIDFGFMKLHQKEREALEKGCYVIEGKFLNDNRADINWKDLKLGLDKCHEHNDRSYVTTNL